MARRLGRLGAVADDRVSLAAALAVRAPRLGHVCVDLATVRATASSRPDMPGDLDALPWPDPEGWLAGLAASPLVGDDRPLHLVDTTLYLDRLWPTSSRWRPTCGRAPRHARRRASTRSAWPRGLQRLFDGNDEPDLQRLAAAAAVLRSVSVIAGGPGTGKTTTVARVLALLDEQASAAGRRPPLVALAAPTGKAAARLEEAVRAGREPGGRRPTWARLGALTGVTLHRLLGFNPGNHTRFRHNRLNRLPHDVVVVDETSMVSLSLMARLVEAVRPEARLILVGDPEQLASVEAGAVLGDIVGPAARGSA